MAAVATVVNRSLGDPVAGLIRGHHRHVGIRAGAYLAKWYLRSAYNEKNWNFRTNGELHLLRAVADECRDAPTSTVFDVGANTGEYARLAVETVRNATVHCFEIVPGTRDTLRTRLGVLPRCIVAPHGLSDQTGTLQIALRHECDTNARVPSQLLEGYSRVVSCEVTTGDDYIRTHGISSIDLLKIDTEGHEMAVMAGFANSIEAGIVKAIQFEYGTTWIPYRKFLHDAYCLLAPAGCCVGRLYPGGVDFKSYDRVRDDHFRMGNYVAVRRSWPQLARRLALSPEMTLTSAAVSMESAEED